MSATQAQLLIVEDEIIVAMDLQRRLERLGYMVLDISVSAEEAYEKAQELNPHLVLMDIRLRGPTDGIEAAGRIYDQTSIPSVFVTAYADEKTLQRAKCAAAYGFVVKPFKEQDLRVAVELALYKYRAAVALQPRHAGLSFTTIKDSDGVIVIGPNQTIEFIDDAARRVLSITPRTLIGDHWSDLVRLITKDNKNVEQILEQLESQKKPVYLQLGRSKGGSRPLRLEMKEDPASGRCRFLHLTGALAGAAPDDQFGGALTDYGILGKSNAIQSVVELIQDVAQVDSTVLIEGETGTGKELVARAIHNRSPRRAGPFVAFNCAGLNEQLAASQFFGHKRGSFTGAISDQLGVFEAAQGGTLFLDELGELPLSVQGTLLRALEEKSVVRVGDIEPRAVDARLVAATNRDLAKEAAENRFRTDLYYRVRVARICVPSLRQRLQDLPLLAESFLREHRQRTRKEIVAITDDAMQLLLAYPWPGNIRELKNTLEFALIRCKGTIIDRSHLPTEFQEAKLADRTPSVDFSGTSREVILCALEQTMGNRKRAAKLLGMSRATFYRRLAEYGL